MDDFEKEVPNFDWRETPFKDHPKGCFCPKHEQVREMIRQSKQTGKIIYRYCPPHYKVWAEEFEKEMKKAKWFTRQMVKLALRLKVYEIRELKYAESDLCFWCRFGSGGRGIKHSPTIQ